jgi:hypothetical protein
MSMAFARSSIGSPDGGAAGAPLAVLAAWPWAAAPASCRSPGPGPSRRARYVDLTRPIIAMGDTQEHESTGYPLHDNDSAIDAYVEVAQRPPEQPLFGGASWNGCCSGTATSPSCTWAT